VKTLADDVVSGVGDVFGRRSPSCGRCCGSTSPPLIYAPGENLGLPDPAVTVLLRRDLLGGTALVGAMVYWSSTCMSASVQSWCIFCSWRVVAVVPTPCALLSRFVPVHGDAAHLSAVFAERRGRGRRGAIRRRCRCCGGLGFVPTRACLMASLPPVQDLGSDRGHGW
jgi:hypothetical protein